jgi:hypothetical protein
VNDFTNKYNTKLSPEQETQFLNWAAANNRLNDVADYDMRGAWANGIAADANAHFPDTYKKPNHPTFSNESIYHGVDGYEGGQWSKKADFDAFTPGRTNLEMRSPQELEQYLKQSDPNVILETAKAGAPMDETMLNALLKTYGAPNTVANANRVREFGAANPEILEKRAMGMRGSGLDDNSDILGAQLDKLMKASDPALDAATDRGTWPGAPGTQPTTPAVAAATKPNAPRRENKTYPNPQEASGTGQKITGEPAPVGGDTQQGGWLDKLWPLLLGVAAARQPLEQTAIDKRPALPAPDGGGTKPIPEATYVGPIDPRTGKPYVDPRAPKVGYTDPRMDPRGAAATAGATAPTPRLADNISDLSRVPTNEPAPTTVTGDPALTEQARKAQIQAEVDAENAAAQRLQDQIMQREADKMRTQKLGEAAKRTLTGRR